MKKIVIIIFLNLFFHNLLFADSSIIELKCESENAIPEIFTIGNYRIESQSYTFKNNIYLNEPQSIEL